MCGTGEPGHELLRAGVLELGTGEVVWEGKGEGGGGGGRGPGEGVDGWEGEGRGSRGGRAGEGK